MPKRVTVTLTDTTLKAIDDWRRTQTPIPSQSEAINKFLKDGMKLLNEGQHKQ
jgi:hypothetical protein